MINEADPQKDNSVTQTTPEVLYAILTSKRVFATVVVLLLLLCFLASSQSVQQYLISDFQKSRSLSQYILSLIFVDFYSSWLFRLMLVLLALTGTGCALNMLFFDKEKPVWSFPVIRSDKKPNWIQIEKNLQIQFGRMDKEKPSENHVIYRTKHFRWPALASVGGFVLIFVVFFWSNATGDYHVVQTPLIPQDLLPKNELSQHFLNKDGLLISEAPVYDVQCGPMWKDVHNQMQVSCQLTYRGEKGARLFLSEGVPVQMEGHVVQLISLYPDVLSDPALFEITRYSGQREQTVVTLFQKQETPIPLIDRRGSILQITPDLGDGMGPAFLLNFKGPDEKSEQFWVPFDAHELGSSILSAPEAKYHVRTYPTWWARIKISEAAPKGIYVCKSIMLYGGLLLVLLAFMLLLLKPQAVFEFRSGEGERFSWQGWSLNRYWKVNAFEKAFTQNTSERPSRD
jgi:hypothetical protein